MTYTHFFDGRCEITTDDFVQRILKRSQIGALGAGGGEREQAETIVTIVTRSHANTQGQNTWIGQQEAAHAPNHQECDMNVWVFCTVVMTKMMFDVLIFLQRFI